MMPTDTSLDRRQNRPGLADLDQVTLDAAAEHRLTHCVQTICGSGAWHARKLVEGHELFALEQIAERMRVVHLDLRDEIAAAIHLDVAVARRGDSQQAIRVEQTALLGLRYPQHALYQDLPGYAFVQVLMPRKCWHANISPDVTQALCLGKTLPAGIRIKELIVMAYGALTMQTVQLEADDPAGVMHHEAAVWWQANLDRIPLTPEPFLGAVRQQHSKEV